MARLVNQQITKEQDEGRSNTEDYMFRLVTGLWDLSWLHITGKYLLECVWGGGGGGEEGYPQCNALG